VHDLKTVKQEAAEDIFFGQVVSIWARWFLIFAGLILTLWTASDETELSVGIIPVIALMAMNFFLHGRYIVGKPANRILIIAAAVLDLTIITLIVAFWPGQTGAASQFFIFYYPVLLAFAFVFPPRFTLIYTVLALAAYAAIYLVFDLGLIKDSIMMETLVMRLITLAATGALGNYYWRIQRDRRRAVRAERAPA
jgi:hypothetical protein